MEGIPAREDRRSRVSPPRKDKHAGHPRSGLVDRDLGHVDDTAYDVAINTDKRTREKQQPSSSAL